AAPLLRGAARGAAGTRGQSYLAARATRPETSERLGLGYAPGGGDALARHLRASGLSLDDAVTVGLVMRRAGGGVLDRFRERLVFPITDPRGRGIAFGGRVLPGDPSPGGPPPQYPNSPEAAILP